MSGNSTEMAVLLTGAVVLVGAGKMGDALLRGWLGRGVPAGRIMVFEPEPGPELQALVNAQPLRLNPPITDVMDAAVLVLAVKPQIMLDVLPQFAPVAAGGALVLSIAAGKPIAFFEQHFAGGAIVRAMPNTPAAIGMGITVLCANARANAQQRQLATALMQAVGEVAWVKNEALMDPVTAVSGSGPAYLFLLIEALAKAGEKAGLDAALAYQLAQQTVSGAAALAAQSDQPASRLRENVTSPGGTTAAALAVLMRADGLQSLMDQAVAAATSRSRDLAK